MKKRLIHLTAFMLILSGWLSCPCLSKAQVNSSLDFYFDTYTNGISIENSRGLLAVLLTEQKNREALSEFMTRHQSLGPANVDYGFVYQGAAAAFLTDSFNYTLELTEELTRKYPEAMYTDSVVLLKLLSMNFLGEFENAKNLLAGYLEFHGLHDSLNAYNNTPLPDRKSVKKAIRLSRFLPGSGLFYARKPGIAVPSLLMQAGFLAYTGYSVYTGYYFTAALTGLKGFGTFHSGGVRASATHTRLYNETEFNTYVFTLNAKLLKTFSN